MVVEQYKKQTIYFGDLSDKKSVQALKQLKGKNVLVVCTERNWAAHRGCLRKCRKNKILFSDFSAEPVYEDIKKAVAIFRDNQCESIISMGNRSAIDFAKCIKAFAGDGETCLKDVEHLAIPRASGIGSESTHFAAMYQNGQKRSVSDPSLLPEYAFLDVECVKNVLNYERNSVMLNAFCQAAESFWSVNSTDESKKYASSAIAYILKYGKKYMNNLLFTNDDYDEMTDVSIVWAASLAQRAVDSVRSEILDAVSRPLALKYNISHGHAAALCLPGVWRFLLSGINQGAESCGKDNLCGTLRQLTRLLGMESDADAVKVFEAVYQRAIEQKKEISVSREDVKELVQSVDAGDLSDYPIKPGTEDIYGIYSQLSEKNTENTGYIFWYTASKLTVIKEEHYNILKVMPQTAVRFQDIQRRTDAAWCMLKCIEYGCFFSEHKADADWKREYQFLAGSFVSYCLQHDAGVYYFKNTKKIIRQIEKEMGESVWDHQAEELSRLLHIDAERAYIYVAEAAVCHEAQNCELKENIAEFLSLPDYTWVYSAIHGMVHQLDLFMFHYFNEEEQEVLKDIFGDKKEAVQQIFREQPEKVIRRNIVVFCYLEEFFEEKRKSDYFREWETFQDEMFKKAKKEFDEAGLLVTPCPLSGGLIIPPSEMDIAVSIAKGKPELLGRMEKTKDSIKLYQQGTRWQKNYDAKETEAFYEFVWGHSEEVGKYPYLAKFYEDVYVFDEEKKEAESLRSRLKEAVLRPFHNLKVRAKHKKDKSAEAKEISRFIVDTKRKIVYTLFYKYRYEVDDKVILFESYHGEQYSCNPRGIYEAILDDERYIDYKFIWAFKDVRKYKFLEEDFRTKVVKSNSKKYYMYNAKAKYIVLNLLLKPHITLKKEQTYIQTWHGKPIKAIGCGRQFETDPRRTLASTIRHYTKNAKKITKLLSPSDYFTPIMRDAFNMKKLHKEDCIYETGYARNDRLFRYTDIDLMRIRQRLGIDPDKKVILYAPTWRELFGEYVDRQNLGVVLRVSDSIDFEKMQRQLGDGYQLLFRAHHMDAEAMDISLYEGFIIDATGYPDVNDLYMISDLMISDYSGTIFDFGILKKPMVFYMFDRELYTTKLQGVNIDLDELPGIIVEKEEELVPAILKQFREFKYDEKYERFNRRYNQYEDGHVGQRVIDLCISDTAAKKTMTLQGLQKILKKRIYFIYRPMRCLKLNIRGILREKGIIRDKNTKQLLALKNKYAGQKCYLIGNGPSLNAKDLDMIQNEVTFGCNMVYKMFSKTKWRPTYHFIVDVIYTKNLYLEIKNNIRSPLITNSSAYHLMAQKPKNITYVDILSQEDYKIRGNMMAYYVSARATVMTFMIEMAIFMGFKEIYLLGTDCTNSFTAGHFGEAYTASTLDKVNLARARVTIGDPNLTLEGLGEYRRQRSIAAYEKIAEYAKEQGVKIYNATRGGALEVFERVRLEDTLK